MTINDILDYVMTTPHNTNRQVLKGMLEKLTSDAAADADADDPVAESITITENGITTAPEGTVYDEVVVNVPIPTVPELETLTITDTSITNYTAPEGKAYNSVVISANPGE